MFNDVVAHVLTELNQYLQLRSRTLEPQQVVAGSLFDLEGKVSQKTRDRVVMSVVNVEKDPVYRSVETSQKRPNGTSAITRPDVRVNLYVLFVANIAEYDEGLKALARVMSFFQLHGSFHHPSLPPFDDQPGRIMFELFSMTFEQQNHLWGALGAKYLPSVMYKAGLIPVQDAQIEAEIPPIGEIAING